MLPRAKHRVFTYRVPSSPHLRAAPRGSQLPSILSLLCKWQSVLCGPEKNPHADVCRGTNWNLAGAYAVVGTRVDMDTTKQCIGHHPRHHPRTNRGTQGHHFLDLELHSCLSFKSMVYCLYTWAEHRGVDVKTG